jgi:hypothetical protein
VPIRPKLNGVQSVNQDFTRKIIFTLPAPISPTMISRSKIGRQGQLALRRQCCVQPAKRRGLAAAVSGSTSFSYDTADVAGVKVASRDVSGPTTKLAVVARAGTRYQSLPGLTVGLEQFAFKVRIYHMAGISCIAEVELTFCQSEHTQKICPKNHKRVRASWRTIGCVPYERGSSG